MKRLEVFQVQENLLYEASEKGDIKTVKYLLKNGVDVDKVFELGVMFI